MINIDKEIKEFCISIEADYIMTSNEHLRASDRCNEAILKLEKDGDKFKAVRRVAKPDSEIFLYSAGVIGPEEVNETYYQLIDVTVEGCVKTRAEYVCNENNEVKAEEVISWNIDDYINEYNNNKDKILNKITFKNFINNFFKAYFG